MTTSQKEDAPKGRPCDVMTAEIEEEEDEPECAMMAYFFSEAPVLKQMVTRPAFSSGLEGCSQLMAASFDHESNDLTADDAIEEDDVEEIEFFEPFGQMNEAVREALLKLAR